MKRFAFLLLLFLLPLTVCLAQTAFEFADNVAVGLHGEEKPLYFNRTRQHAECDLVLEDEQGRELCRRTVSPGRTRGALMVTVTPDMPISQTVSMYIETDGQKTLQDTCLLVTDRVNHAGIRKVDTEEKKIAITFDAANGKGVLEDILDLLDEYGAKCSFFIQRSLTVYHPDLVLEIDRRGHEIGSHSVTHPDMRKISCEKMLWEIEFCSDAISALTGKPVTLYRPPSGYNTYRDRAIGRALGQECILWTKDSLDGFKEYGFNRIWLELNSCQEEGAIILMHIYGSHTLEALRAYIPMMQEKGFSFVTVSQLLHENGYIDEDGVQRAQ